MNRLFRGHSSNLFVATAPYIIGVVAIKSLLIGIGFQPLDLSPLLAGAIGAEVFIVGFLLTGTAGDFKEAERLPGEIASSMETIADELLIIHATDAVDSRKTLGQLLVIGKSVLEFLLENKPFDHVLVQVRAMNDNLAYFTLHGVNITYVKRMKDEQASIRKTTLRMETMRRTSYVAAGYLIAEVVAGLLVLAMVLTDLGPISPTDLLVGVLSALLIYLVFLIRDLDNPFEYHDGKPGAADVSLEVLELTVLRLQKAYDAMPAESPDTSSPASAALAAAVEAPVEAPAQEPVKTA